MCTLKRRTAQSRVDIGQGCIGVLRTLRGSLSSCAVVFIMAVAKDYFGNLSSESGSENEFEKVMLLYDICRGKRSVWKSEYMEKREIHGEFALTSELSDALIQELFQIKPRSICRCTP